MRNILKKNIGEIVSDDYRTAHIFKKHDIDFCCKGNRSIQEIARENNINVVAIVDEIRNVQNSKAIQGRYPLKWPLDVLADYVERKHHKYVEENIPVLRAYLEKLCKVHGKEQPEILKIKEIYNAAAGDLAIHMKKEELMVFPAIRKMVQAKKDNAPLMKFKFDTIQNPIKKMRDEHEDEGARFNEIRTLSNNYTPPDTACATYHITYALLKEFEEDLHEHIHLENNILFPKSEELEKQLADLIHKRTLSKAATLKRDIALQPLSRDHHHGLLLCWKIRAGFSKQIDTKRMKKYIDWFFTTYLVPHFELEEQHIFPILGSQHKLVKKALSEHRRISRLFRTQTDLAKNLNFIEEELAQHIRFEERILFNEIQKVATKKQLQSIENLHSHEKFSENTTDEFWK